MDARPRPTARLVLTIAWPALGVALASIVVLDARSARDAAAALTIVALALAAASVAGRRSAEAGGLGIIAGSIGVVCGWSLGMRYVLADAASLRSSVALVVLASGGIVLVTSAVALVRLVRWRWRVPTAAGLVGVVVLTGLAVSPGVLAANVPHVPARPASPADLGIAFEEVDLRTADGVRLVAWYVPSRNGAAVVLRHGSGATRADELGHLVPLVAAGFGVLVPDSRGHGGSGGDGNDFGWSGEMDLVAAVDLLARRPDVQPERIGVVGISLGGMEAIGAAGADRRIRAVVAEGPTRRSAADLVWLADRRGAAGAAQLAMAGLQTSVSALVTATSAPPAMADSVEAAANTSFLLVIADLADERESAAYIEARAPSRVSVWVAGSMHARGLDESPTEWPSRVVGFLSEHLLGR